MALKAHSLDVGVLAGPSGRPLVPNGFVASISHKRSVSVAILTSVFEGIGVDIEHVDDSDLTLATKVLTKFERDRLERSTELSAAAVTVHFALKEAVYKAAPDADQDDLEFEDIELTSGAALTTERAWMSCPVTVRRSASEYRAFVYRRDLWVLAVAARTRS